MPPALAIWTACAARNAAGDDVRDVHDAYVLARASAAINAALASTGKVMAMVAAVLIGFPSSSMPSSKTRRAVSGAASVSALSLSTGKSQSSAAASAQKGKSGRASSSQQPHSDQAAFGLQRHL